MFTARRSCAFALIATIAAGCSEPGSPVEPVTSRVAPSAAPLADHGDQGHSLVRVNVLDVCDKATFDAAIGDGTCVRPHGKLFADFIAELTRTKTVGDWRFEPSQIHVQIGQSLVAFNRGGEVHSFTEVDEFGGGIVPLLNHLAGTPSVAPECAALAMNEFLPPGGTQQNSPETTVGTEKYQCCIHPWMKTVVTIAAASDGSTHASTHAR
jgi:plastocyanin